MLTLACTMVVSERSFKKLRDFLSPTVKVKHRFASLQSFHEYANQLEQAEFYEDNSELIFLFLLECYLLMIGKSWVIEASSELTAASLLSDPDSTANFAFGPDCVVRNYNLTIQNDTSDALMSQSRRISPTNSENQGKWLNSIRKERSVDEFLKFPLVFSNLLQYVSIGKLLASPLAPFLVGLIGRLLHPENLPVLQEVGIRMLLNLLKASSHEVEHPITAESIKMFKSLINVDRLCDNLSSDSVVVSLHTSLPLINRNRSEFADDRTSKGVDLEVLNEILAFITWDLNPDLHSTRFLYNLVRDSFLSEIYPIAFASSRDASARVSLARFDEQVCGKIQELVVDYLALWFLQSGTRDFKFGGSTLATNLRSSDRSASMVSLVVNDLTSFFNRKNAAATAVRLPNFSSSGDALKLRKDQKPTDFPVASFLLDEIILNSKRDVIFLHLILKSACLTLSFAAHLFSIKLSLEIFRSWLFNPASRRPNFLKDSGELEEFVTFYLDTLEGLFPHKHRSLANQVDEDQRTLTDRVEIYREAFYFFRAAALQAFFPLSLDCWLQLLSIEIVTIDLLLSPDNLLERPFFTTEDSIFAETLLGSLMRSCEHFRVKEMQEKWRDASRVLSKCSGCRGVIEEWCRVVETLALLLVKDSRYSKHPLTTTINSSIQSATSSTTNISSISPIATPSVTSNASSSSSLPPSTASFSAWPDLPVVRGLSVNLFRNVLRLLGDPAESLQELKLVRPDLMTLIFEAFNRCLDILMKCRMDQTVRIPLYNVPPFVDLLPAALSALLNLRSYNSIISSKLSSVDALHVAHDSCRIISWRIVGVIMFRPADIVISDHFWAALLVAVRECLNEPMSAAEFTALYRYVALPISTASIPGCTVLLSEIIDGMLRFFNDTLWSGNSTMAFSASEASILIPVSMKVISNALKLSRLFPEQFGHFREADCLPRLFKMLISCINDSKLLVVIHTALADIYCSECINDGENEEFLKVLLELVLEPFSFSRGSTHVCVVICLCEYISLLAYLSVSFKESSLIDSSSILDSLIKALEVSLSRPELSEASIRIIEGPLTDWILFALRGRVPEEFSDRFFALFDVKCSFRPVSMALELFSVRFMTHSRTFPGILGPNIIGSAAFTVPKPSIVLASLALTPSQTILIFESSTTDSNNKQEIFVTMRNPFGKFIWKIGALWGTDNNENENQTSFNVSLWNEVLDNSEFALPKVSLRGEEDCEPEEFKDLLAELLEKLNFEVKKESFVQTNLPLILDKDLKEQREFEAKMNPITIDNSVEFDKYEAKLPEISSKRFSILLRLLLSSLSLTRPDLYSSPSGAGFGLKVLNELGDSLLLDEELAALDEISSRFKVKVGCIFMPAGVCDEEDLLNNEGNDLHEMDDGDYRDFCSGIVSENDGISSSVSIEFELEEIEKLKAQGMEALEIKKHLGNDSVLIIWHGDNTDTVVNRSPLRSDLTAAIIRIRRHELLPGWFNVTLQTCFERLMQPRKFARLRVDPFALFSENDLEGGGSDSFCSEVDGVFMGHDIQRSGILVPRASLSLLVKSLACAAWRQAHLINCLRSTAPATNSSCPPVDAQARIKFSPEMVRKDRIEEIINRYGMHDLSYDKFLFKLFQ